MCEVRSELKSVIDRMCIDLDRVYGELKSSKYGITGKEEGHLLSALDLLERSREFMQIRQEQLNLSAAAAEYRARNLKNLREAV
jgi:hypothetical protein